MPRSPAPEVGFAFDDTFPARVLSALELNAAIHDGAIMIGRPDTTGTYRITGWSYRLYPPHVKGCAEVNRGSAYNSCHAMAQVPSIDHVYLVSGGSYISFPAENG